MSDDASGKTRGGFYSPQAGGACEYAGPGRGDCEHWVGDWHGLPTDAYGKPKGYCWQCWKSARIAELEAERDALRLWARFGQWALDAIRIDVGGDIDGGEAQETAEALGLLMWVEVAEPCGKACRCSDYGDEFPTECLRLAVPRACGGEQGNG